MKRWPLNKAHFWERLPFFRLLLPLVAGIVFYPGELAQSNTFLLYLITAMVLSAGVYIITAVKQQASGTIKFISFCSVSISIIFLAWILCYFHDDRNKKDWFGHSVDTAEAYAITVTSTPAEKEHTWKLEVAVNGSFANDSFVNATGKAFLYIYKYDAPAIKEGDVLIVPNNWKHITNSGNPFEFDYAGFASRNNIHYQQFVPGSKILIHKYADRKDLNLTRRIHLYCIDILHQYIHDNATLGLMQAMLMGDKAELDISLRQAYADTGIVHIIAISGAHIAIFFLLISFLLGWIKHRRYNWIKYIAALPLIWIYVLVAGAPPSAVRAATMFSILAIGFALQKEPNGINQLLAAAFILLCINPAWLYDVGFQLSFIAVLSIFVFYKSIFRSIPVYNKILRGIWSAISVSIAAEILVAPLVIFYFHLFPVQFIVANIIAYLFMGVILITGLLLLALSPFNILATHIGNLLSILTGWFHKVIFKLQALNPESFHRLTLTTIELLLIYLFIGCVALNILNKKKTYLLVALTTLSLLTASLCYREYKALNQNLLIVYNTGKQNYIEIIEGKKSRLLTSEKEIPDDVTFFALKPAHIAYHISKTIVDSTSNYFIMSDKTFLLLNNPPADTTMNIDYLIINYKIKAKHIPAIIEHLHPKLIILGNNLSSAKSGNIANEFINYSIPVHNTHSNGAFIFKQD